MALTHFQVDHRASPRRPAANPSGDYRSMVEAIQTDDLAAAQHAFGRFTRGLPAASYDATTTLGKIGAALDQGDLKSAQSILDGLEKPDEPEGRQGPKI